MSIQPIDLQTLFMRLNQIGKEQAVLKEAAHLAQSLQGSDMARKSEEQSHTVNESRELEEGPEAVKDEDSKNAEEGESEEKQDKSKEEKKANIFRDPDLGSKVDITG